MSALPLPGSDAAMARGTRAVVVASAAAVTVAAWLWLRGASAPHGIHSAVLGLHRHRLDLASSLYALVMWQAMMVAMMTPAFLRWMLAFAALTADPTRAASRFRPVAALASGYFVAWLAYSLGAASIQVALHRAGLLGDGRVAESSAGVLLILAGAFQLAPFKRACLTHCRNPLTFFLSRWRSGPVGGFRLGIIHGAYCVGCCWLLMITGFALGVMNMAWMAVLTLVIAAEQVLPHGERIAGLFGLAIAGWGVSLLL